MGYESRAPTLGAILDRTHRVAEMLRRPQQRLLHQNRPPGPALIRAPGPPWRYEGSFFYEPASIEAKSGAAENRGGSTSAEKMRRRNLIGRRRMGRTGCHGWSPGGSGPFRYRSCDSGRILRNSSIAARRVRPGRKSVACQGREIGRALPRLRCRLFIEGGRSPGPEGDGCGFDLEAGCTVSGFYVGSTAVGPGLGNGGWTQIAGGGHSPTARSDRFAVFPQADRRFLFLRTRARRRSRQRLVRCFGGSRWFEAANALLRQESAAAPPARAAWAFAAELVRTVGWLRPRRLPKWAASLQRSFALVWLVQPPFWCHYGIRPTTTGF